MGKLMLTEVVVKMESTNWSNFFKRPYVRVADRETLEWDVEGGYTLRSYVNVYSKTWSRRVSRLYNVDGKLPRWYNLAEAKRLLKSQVTA